MQPAGPDHRLGRRRFGSLVVAATASSMLGCATKPLQLASDEQLAAAVASLGFRADGTVAVAAGDIADCDDLQPAAATARLVDAVIDAFPAAWVFTTGDHAYEDGTRIEFERCYDPTWGQFNERTAPTPGNHDYDSDAAAPYYEYFKYYENDQAARQRGYYGFDAGTWHVVSLNSNLSMDEASAQLRWLESDLVAAGATCILAYWHHPLFSSGLHGRQARDNGRDTDTFWNVLSAFGAELIVNGHAHMYERFAPQHGSGQASDSGISQIVVGTGGAQLDAAIGRRSNSRYVNDSVYGVVILALHEASYEWAFIGTDGVVYDRSAEPTACRANTVSHR